MWGNPRNPLIRLIRDSDTARWIGEARTRRGGDGMGTHERLGGEVRSHGRMGGKVRHAHGGACEGHSGVGTMKRRWGGVGQSA